jgi:ubiquinone/menaquinone biosynthesis C-methylase UbiE
MKTDNIDYWEKTLKNPPKSYIKLFRQEKDYLRKSIKQGEKVLDIGCGEGRNILSIIDITDNVVGIDIDQKAVEDTKINLKDYPRVDILLGSATSLPFDDENFDTVIFSMTIVNLDSEKEKALSEMKRVVKRDGKIILSVYSDKALEERRNMYKQVEVPIKSEVNGKFIFDIDGFVSEQFSISDIEKMIEPLGLKIDNCEEVDNLAYIFTLKKV